MKGRKYDKIKKVILGIGGVATTTTAIITPIVLTSKSSKEEKTSSTKKQYSKDISDIESKIKNIFMKELKILSGKNAKLEALKQIKEQSDYPSDEKGVSVSIKENQLDISSGSPISFTLILKKGDGESREITSFSARLITDQELVNFIKNKIQDKTLTLKSDAAIESDSQILDSIKEQLKIENKTLTKSDIEKITDNITTFKLNVRNIVTLTITSNDATKQVDIVVFKSPLDQDVIDQSIVYLIWLKIKNTDIIIPNDANVSTDTNLWIAIKEQLKILNPSLTESDLLRIDDNIESLTLSDGNSHNAILTISEGIKNRTVNITITKELPNSRLIDSIRSKIRKKNLTLPSNANTTTDEAILNSIKTQLKVQNPTLTNKDLEKITDNVTSFNINEINDVTLTITARTGEDTKTSTLSIKVAKEGYVQGVVSKIIDKKILFVENEKIWVGGKKDFEGMVKRKLKIDNPLLRDSDLINMTLIIENRIWWNSPTLNYDLIIEFGTEKQKISLAIQKIWNDSNIEYNKFWMIREKFYSLREYNETNSLKIARNVDTSTKESVIKAIKNSLKKSNEYGLKEWQLDCLYFSTRIGSIYSSKQGKKYKLRLHDSMVMKTLAKGKIQLYVWIFNYVLNLFVRVRLNIEKL